MEIVVSELLRRYEAGRMSRRQLIQGLAAAALAASTPAAATAQGQTGFRTIRLDHVSYQVRDYQRTRDFYKGLLGMPVDGDNGKDYCQLLFGESHRQGARARSFLGVRTRSADAKPPNPGPSGRIDHLAFTIEDWDTTRVRTELERRGMKPRPAPAGAGDTANYMSFYVEDPDGFEVQISGIARPGDAAYRG